MTDKKTEALKLALEKVQEFKARWWKVPPFGNKVNKATREAITNAHSPIFELENTIREALAEQPAQQQCMEHGECFGGECIYPATQPAQQHIEHCLWARNGNQPCPHVQPEQEPVAWAEFDFEAQKFTGRTAAKFSDVESVGHRCEWVPQLHQPTHQPAQQQEPVAVTYKEVWGAMNALYAGDIKQVQIALEMENKKLYTSPPASKPWVSLTELEALGAYEAEQQGRWGDHVRGLLAIEAKLKAKNSL